MLTSQYLDALPDDLIDLYEAYTQSVINDIARRLNKMGGLVTESAAWQLQRVNESGLVYENALREIAKLTGQSQSQLKKLFEKAGVKSLAFDDNIYKLAGLKPIPLNLSPAMFDVMRIGLAKTNNTMRNLTRTTALSAQESFIKAADLAYMQVTHGAMSYDQAIRSAIKQTAAAGLQVIHYPTGHRDQLDVAMRRAVLTGVQQTTAALQMTRADQMNQDLVQISAHRGARPTHAVWQGQIFSRSGKDKRYPDLVASTGYGSGDGLAGWNCRHSMYPFFPGISENAYKKADVDAMNARTVKLHGKDVDQYTASQVQRSYERKIRFYKREAGALGAIGKDNTTPLLKVSQYQARLRAFVKETKLIRQPAREGPRVKRVKIKPSTPPPAPKPAAPPRKPAPIIPRKASLNIPKAEVNDAAPRISTDGTKIRHNERELKRGAFNSARVTIDGNGDAILKTNTSWSGWGTYNLNDGFAKREVMAYELDQALGLGIVPRTTPFIENDKYMSLQRWVDDANIGARVDGSTRLADISEPGKMTLLDFITGNIDRHGENWLLTKAGHVRAIDNGLAMTSVDVDDRLPYIRKDINLQFNKFYNSSWRSKGGEFFLSSQYKDTLQRIIESGELESILQAASTSDPVANSALVDAALSRARLVIADWDKYFVDP